MQAWFLQTLISIQLSNNSNFQWERIKWSTQGFLPLDRNDWVASNRLIRDKFSILKLVLHQIHHLNTYRVASLYPSSEPNWIKADFITRPIIDFPFILMIDQPHLGSLVKCRVQQLAKPAIDGASKTVRYLEALVVKWMFDVESRWIASFFYGPWKHLWFSSRILHQYSWWGS